MIQAAFFDMDGLLIDSEAIYNRGVQAVMGRLGLYISEEQLTRALGANMQATDAIFAEGNPNYDGAALRDALGQWLAENGYLQRMPLLPHAAEILQNLTAAGIPCALVTSSPLAQATQYLEGPGLMRYFSAVVTGDLHLPSKPAPGVYLHAAQLLRVDIARCAVLEDSYNGLRAGRAAGAMTIMVPNLIPYGPDFAPYCDHVARTLKEAEEIMLCR